jgi:hypothetical protein
MDAIEVPVHHHRGQQGLCTLQGQREYIKIEYNPKIVQPLKSAFYVESLRKWFFVILQKLKFHTEVISFRVIPCDSAEYFTT